MSNISTLLAKNPVIKTGLGTETKYFSEPIQQSLEKVMEKFPAAVDEFKKRANVEGQFLSWVDLPKKQAERVDYIYSLVDSLKAEMGNKKLSVLGIGGSKHTVEHLLGVNGLNIDGQDVLLYSDIDSVSKARFLKRLGGDVANSMYLVVSKSGSTFETKDGMMNIRSLLEESYASKGYSKEESSKLAAKHFIAVTDKNPEGQLRSLANKEGWKGELFVHDDVGGRFSALDDHGLFALAYAGMSKTDVLEMLKGAADMSELALSKDFSKNDPVMQAGFWVASQLQGITENVQQFLGDMFEKTALWYTQMLNESLKHSKTQVAKVPDAMHHSAEAHMNPANNYAFSLTSPVDKGGNRENLQGYTEALNRAYSKNGPHFNEKVETNELGLTPRAAGALTQAKAFTTVYREILDAFTNGKSLPEVLNSVLQPHVEVYKKEFKAIDGNEPPVVPGRIS